jgi:glycerol kinase
MASDDVSNRQIFDLLSSLQKRVEALEMKPDVSAADDANAAPDLSVLVGAIDQGTTSSRFLIFNREGTPVASHQVEFKQIYPNSG